MVTLANAPVISISLVSFNQLGDVKRLLPSLIPAAQVAQAEILLVDNYCQDKSLPLSMKISRK